MKFSIIFPSRERITLLNRFILSIKNNTFNIEDIEVLVAVDVDDVPTYDFLISQNWSFVKLFKVQRSLNFSKDYYNFLAMQSTGKWIITGNDDAVMETPEWDRIAYDVLKDRPGVIYGWIEDGLGAYRAKGHGDYCCFPLMGRKGYEALGYIFPERVPTWGCDIWAKKLYDSVNSVVKLPLTMRHFCYHNHTREQDHISRRIASNQVPFDTRPTYQEINKLLEALKLEKANVN